MKLRLLFAIVLIGLVPRVAWAAAQASGVARVRIVAGRDMVRVPLADRVPSSETSERQTAPPVGDAAVGVVVDASAQKPFTLNFE